MSAFVAASVDRQQQLVAAFVAERDDALVVGHEPPQGPEIAFENPCCQLCRRRLERPALGTMQLGRLDVAPAR